MRKVVLFISSYEREKSNSYLIGEYIEKNLSGKVKCKKVFLEEESVRDLNREFKEADNIVLISSLRHDKLNKFSKEFIYKIKEENKREDFFRSKKFSAILSGDSELLRETESLNLLLDGFSKICNKRYITWQKGIGILARMNLFEIGLDENVIEYEQLIIELELFCQDLLNDKSYHNNSFAIPKKGGSFFKFINNKLKGFT